MIFEIGARHSQTHGSDTSRRERQRTWLLGFLAQLILYVTYSLPPAYARTIESPGTNEAYGIAGFSAVEVAGPFEYPWSFAFLPDRSILVTERPGRLQLIAPGLTPREVTGLPPIFSSNHAGLLDVAIDPGFPENRIVYLSYAHESAAGFTMRVLRAKLDHNRALIDHRIIFESHLAANSDTQLGGRIAVTDDGHLFLSLGDGWKAELAQDLSVHDGSIIRILTDGSIPEDNPFLSVARARPEVWSYGHRNPQGLAIDPETGLLWSHEHGPMGGDELNLIIGGRNYGWPIVTYGLDYSGKPIGEGTAKDGMQQPIHYWTPAIAPSGLSIQNNKDITIFWIGALAGQSLIRLEMQNGQIVHEQRFFKGEVGRIRDVRTDSGGALYFITDSPEGRLFRLEPAVGEAMQRGNNRRY